MIRYLVLISFTEQGVRDVKQTITRAGEFRSAVEAAGGKVTAQYWSLGGGGRMFHFRGSG